MSNPLTIKNSDMKDLKKSFLDLTSSGNIEAKALETLNLTRGQYIKMYLDDPEFAKQIEEARKSRAEYWVSKIANSIDDVIDAKDVPSEKLRFDKLQYLARADDPDRYGSNSKSKIDISLDLKQFKLLPPDEAVKALANDPFAIEAEFTEVINEGDHVSDCDGVEDSSEDLL